MSKLIVMYTKISYTRKIIGGNEDKKEKPSHLKIDEWVVSVLHASLLYLKGLGYIPRILVSIFSSK